MSKEELAAKLKQIKILEDNINEYKDAFDIFDKDKTGFISTKDIIKIKKIFSYQINEEKIENMIAEIASTGEGIFDFKKFLILMKKQIQYIEEKEKNRVLESYKEEYLGNKRKRENLIDDESIKQEEKMHIINNDPSINNENEEMLDSMQNDISSNIDMNYNIIKKIDNKEIEVKQELKREGINTKITTKPTTKKIIDYNNEIIISNNSKMKRSKKSNRIKSKSKTNSKKSSIPKDTNILINKNILPKEMINKIEPKKKHSFSVLQIENNINYNIPFIPIKENILPSQKLITSFSSKCMSEIDLNNLSNMNSRENSFLSERSNDIFNRPALFPYCINTRLDRTPLIKVKRKKDKITNSSEKLLKGIKDKLMQKGIKLNNSKNENKENSTFILKEKLQKIVNDKFYSLEENTIKEDNTILNEDKKILDINKSKEEIITINMNEDESIKILEDSTISKNIENNPIIKDKNLKEKITIVNSFQLEYKLNEQNEKIIQNVTEIPYLIIIDKNEINLEEIKNVFPRKINSKQKIESKTSKAESNYIFTILNQNEEKQSKNDSLILNNSQYQSKINIEKESQITPIKNENEKIIKYETQNKNIVNNYKNFEKNKGNSKFLFSNENNFTINNKYFDTALQDKKLIEEDNKTKEENKYKNIKCIKNENYENLNTSDLIGELSSYLYLKENQS